MVATTDIVDRAELLDVLDVEDDIVEDLEDVLDFDLTADELELRDIVDVLVLVADFVEVLDVVGCLVETAEELDVLELSGDLLKLMVDKGDLVGCELFVLVLEEVGVNVSKTAIDAKSLSMISPSSSYMT